eukprot:1518990-Pyramimonas_sp.AAC.1
MQKPVGHARALRHPGGQRAAGQLSECPCARSIARGSDVMPKRHPAHNKRLERVLEAGARPRRSRSGRNAPAWLDLMAGARHCSM